MTARHTGAGRPPHPRAPALIASGAAAVALWLGLTAPSVSPVAPPPPVAPTPTVTTTFAGPGAIGPRPGQPGLLGP